MKLLNPNKCQKCGISGVFCPTTELNCSILKSMDSLTAQRQKRDFDAVRSAVVTICDKLSAANNDTNIVTNAIASELAVQHRTTQQMFANKVLRGVIEYFADCDAEKRFDGRNEAACEAGTQLKAVMDDCYMPYI